MQIDVDFPEKLQFLFQPYRYKVAYGGRGGAKSWNYARALLLQGLDETKLIVCAREIQKSIADSVHRLLASQIELMGLSEYYEILQTTIRSRVNGTEFIFAGLKHNIANVKSLEGADVVWVEEAQTVSKASWDVLIPTVRKEGSEIWIAFNPDLEDDYTYQRFVLDPPPNTHVVKVNWDDNPWFPETLREEKDDLRRRDPVAYRHVWEGYCKQAIEGAIFAKEIDKAAEEGRLTRVPVQSGVPVNTAWDLGHSDNTAIWFYQLVGMEYRLIDYYQANGEKMGHYLDVLARKGYSFGDHYLPHDAENEQLAAAKTIRQQVSDAIRDNPALGKMVHVVPRTPQKVIAIEAARDIFARCIFDRDKTTDGLQCLRRYRYERDEQTGKVSKNPVHDQWSHGADAFLTMAQHARRPATVKRKITYNTAWIK